MKWALDLSPIKVTIAQRRALMRTRIVDSEGPVLGPSDAQGPAFQHHARQLTELEVGR
jgi:hypothetical protein